MFGNDLATLPDFPAEIRAPAGTLAGVSAFQVHISDHEITTPGDAPNVLVAMNPAALRAELHRLEPGGTLIVNTDAFDERNLTKAGYRANPLDRRQPRRLHGLRGADDQPHQGGGRRTSGSSPATPSAPRTSSPSAWCRGCTPGRSSRPSTGSRPSFGVEAAGRATPTSPPSRPATPSARRPSCSTTPTRSSRPPLPPGTYTNINGNTALAWGLIAAGQLAGLPLFLGSYPITPASDILHELSEHKDFGVRTLQAEDEIAGIGAALGAAFGGHLGVTTTSGPGLALKSETMGLAISLELPLLIIDVQRGGPSTGLPTKTEAADLLQAMYGRHGESPLPIVAANSPSHCFDAAIEAARIALKYRTPVILLSDGYLANGSEPWRLPDVDDLPDISVAFATEPNHTDADGNPEFWPYLRDPETLARPWAVPGTPGLDAPHRRPREGGRHAATSPTTRPTTSAWSTCGPPRSPASPSDIPPVDGRRATRRRRPARARLGLHVGRHRRRRRPLPGPRARRWPAPTSPTSTRSPATWARCCTATRRCSCPR